MRSTDGTVLPKAAQHTGIRQRQQPQSVNMTHEEESTVTEEVSDTNLMWAMSQLHDCRNASSHA